jgi:hypothetical protein
MDTERIIDLLDTLTAADLRRVLAHAQELDKRYSEWADPRNYQIEEQTTGTYVQEYVKCGKPGCKSCSELGGHGPYWYHYTSENGKTKKKYIGKTKPQGTP